MESFDVIVIGGGSAGYAAARTARENSEKVAIVDSSAELGGLCILRGCMPSKTLIYSAEVMHLAKEGKLFGLDIPSVKADMPGLHARKVRMIDDFKSYRQEQLVSDRFTLFRERGRFTGPETFVLEESGTELTARAFVVATGSVVEYPPVPGLDLEGIWTSDEILDLDFLPETIIVLGGGVVACELSQFLQRVGSKVTQIQRSPNILKVESEEASTVVLKAMRSEGVDLRTGTQLKGIEKDGDLFKVTFREGSETHVISSPYLVNAMGRRAATDHLGLAEAGVDLNEDCQIAVNDMQQSSNPRIYAAGDVCGPLEIVHLAIMQGETAAKHATGQPAEPVDFSTRTTVVFTDPQLASAGIPLKEARESGMDLVVADYPFDDHGKSILMEARAGFVRVWAERSSGRVIGAECVGKDAGELIHAMAVAVSLKATAADLLKVHWYHPTLSEIWSYPLEDIVDELS